MRLFAVFTREVAKTWRRLLRPSREPNGPEEQGESEENEGKEEAKVNPESTLDTRMKKMGEYYLPARSNGPSSHYRTNLLFVGIHYKHLEYVILEMVLCS